MLLQLKHLLKLRDPPAVIGATGQRITIPIGTREERGAPSPTTAKIAQLRKLGKRVTGAGVLAGERSYGERGVARVGVPSAIAHRSLRVAHADDQPSALAHALDSLSPRAALVVLPDDAPIQKWLTRMHRPRVQPPHHRARRPHARRSHTHAQAHPHTHPQARSVARAEQASSVRACRKRACYMKPWDSPRRVPAARR